MDDADLTVPDHLRPLLGAAVELELETTSDGFWPDDNAARAEHRDAIMSTAHMVDNWQADCPTQDEVARLAHRAIGEQEPGQWPRTLQEADELVTRARLTRDLIQLRDMLGGKPTQAELNKPD